MARAMIAGFERVATTWWLELVEVRKPDGGVSFADRHDDARAAL